MVAAHATQKPSDATDSTAPVAKEKLEKNLEKAVNAMKDRSSNVNKPKRRSRGDYIHSDGSHNSASDDDEAAETKENSPPQKRRAQRRPVEAAKAAGNPMPKKMKSSDPLPTQEKEDDNDDLTILQPSQQPTPASSVNYQDILQLKRLVADLTRKIATDTSTTAKADESLTKMALSLDNFRSQLQMHNEGLTKNSSKTDDWVNKVNNLFDKIKSIVDSYNIQTTNWRLATEKTDARISTMEKTMANWSTMPLRIEGFLYGSNKPAQTNVTAPTSAKPSITSERLPKSAGTRIESKDIGPLKSAHCFLCDMNNHSTETCGRYAHFTDRRLRAEALGVCTRCLQKHNSQSFEHIGCPQTEKSCNECARLQDDPTAANHHELFCSVKYSEEHRNAMKLLRKGRNNTNRKAKGGHEPRYFFK